MAYIKTNWISTTPINTTNLNKIEEGIEQNSNDIENINTKIGDLTTLNTTEKSNLVGAVNEVNNKHNYSTEEQVIGTWLGKPLYRKILDLGNVSFISGINAFNHNISNLDVLTSFDIKAYFSEQNSWYTWWSAYGTMRIDKTQLHITSSSSTTFSQVYVVLEYTKTTD